MVCWSGLLCVVGTATGRVVGVELAFDGLFFRSCIGGGPPKPPGVDLQSAPAEVSSQTARYRPNPSVLICNPEQCGAWKVCGGMCLLRIGMCGIEYSTFLFCATESNIVN